MQNYSANLAAPHDVNFDMKKIIQTENENKFSLKIKEYYRTTEV